MHSIWWVWGNISTGWIFEILNPWVMSNSMSLTIVIGLQEIYNNLKSCSFLRLPRKVITFLCRPSLGGSTITSHRFLILATSSIFVIRAFSAAFATKRTCFSSQFILALCSASMMASGTISIPMRWSHVPALRKLNQMLPVPQYRSRIFPSICPTISIASEKSCSAPYVFVWKKLNGDILKEIEGLLDCELRITDLSDISEVASDLSDNTSFSYIYPSPRNVLVWDSLFLIVSARPLL